MELWWQIISRIIFTQPSNLCSKLIQSPKRWGHKHITYCFQGRIICSIHPVLLVPICFSKAAFFSRFHVLFSRPFSSVWHDVHKPRHVATKNNPWRLHSFELLHECSQIDLFYDISCASWIKPWPFHPQTLEITFITFELKGHVFTHHPIKVTFSQNCQAWDICLSSLQRTQQLGFWSHKPVGWNYFRNCFTPLVVNWWFVLVVRLPGIPSWKGLLLRGTPRIPNHKPKNTHLPLVDSLTAKRFSLAFV